MDYKKMMTVAGALICASAMAGVESSVVGYQNLDVATGQKSYVGATFARVNGGKVTLGDIGVNENFAPVSDMITVLNEYGGEGGAYIYVTKELCDAYNDGTGFTFVPGWYDVDEFGNWDGESTLPNCNAVQLYDGEAVMVQSDSDDAALVSAGVVDDQAAELPLITGAKTFLCNCAPQTITLGEITVNENFAPVSDMITFLNQYGGEEAAYIYVTQELCDAYNDGTGFTFVPGWYNVDEFGNWDGESTLPNYNSRQLSAGAGFMVQSDSTDAAIIVPSAL